MLAVQKQNKQREGRRGSTTKGSHPNVLNYYVISLNKRDIFGIHSIDWRNLLCLSATVCRLQVCLPQLYQKTLLLIKSAPLSKVCLTFGSFLRGIIPSLQNIKELKYVPQANIKRVSFSIAVVRPGASLIVILSLVFVATIIITYPTTNHRYLYFYWNYDKD